MSLSHRIPIDAILDHCRKAADSLKLAPQPFTVMMGSSGHHTTISVCIAPGLNEIFDLNPTHLIEPEHSHA